MPKSFLWSALVLIALSACSGKADNSVAATASAVKDSVSSVSVPTFCSDSAFAYVKAQCAFGPRVPNSKAHRKCQDYLIATFTRLGAKVTCQKTDLKAFDGTVLHANNITASYYPQNNRRVVFFAHYDCRPFADQDAPAHHLTPIDGANDGASGVAVLMEVARLLQQSNPGVGVDLVMLDAEDYGSPDNVSKGTMDDERTWCLGSQYWAQNLPYTAQNKPFMGILLDMVGGSSPEFTQETFSQQYAQSYMDDFWATASSLALDSYFTANPSSTLIDDHYFINTLAGIPTFDVIDFNRQRGFPAEWHTLKDDVHHIDPNTLNVVGKVLVQYLFTKLS